MTDQELETRLAQAVDRAAPNDVEGVLSRCREQTGKVVPMTKTKTTRPFPWRALIAACLALVLVGGGAGVFYQNAHAVTSVVSIDVNPSIELRVNKDEKVLSCTPVNEEAHIVLGEMNDGKDLEGAKLTVAVNAIVGALVRHGYLDGLSNAILVSVEDKDQARAQRMEEELRSSISGILEAEAPNTTVLSQTLPGNTGEGYYHYYATQQTSPSDAPDTDSVERVHPISSGKAALVDRVIALRELTGTDRDAEYEKLFTQLSALTVEELSDLLETGETRIPIGCAAAGWAAQDHAGTLALSSDVVQDVDPELDKRPAYYEVELVVNGVEYEYRVDAFTGEVLSGQADILAPVDTPAPVTTQAPTPTVTATPSPTGVIGEDAAWTYACTHAGCKVGDIQFTTCELDREDGVYELEFCWNGNQYDYEIDCYSGTVVKWDREVCDEVGHHHGGTVTAPTPAPTATPAASQGLIGEDAAWTAACKYVGCGLEDMSYAICELDREDGVYELEFCWQGDQYECEVDCATGTVLQCESEVCDNGLHNCRGGGHHGWGHH